MNHEIQTNVAEDLNRIGDLDEKIKIHPMVLRDTFKIFRATANILHLLKNNVLYGTALGEREFEIYVEEISSTAENLNMYAQKPGELLNKTELPISPTWFYSMCNIGTTVKREFDSCKTGDNVRL